MNHVTAAVSPFAALTTAACAAHDDEPAGTSPDVWVWVHDDARRIVDTDGMLAPDHAELETDTVYDRKS